MLEIGKLLAGFWPESEPPDLYEVLLLAQILEKLVYFLGPLLIAPLAIGPFIIPEFLDELRHLEKRIGHSAHNQVAEKPMQLDLIKFTLEQVYPVSLLRQTYPPDLSALPHEDILSLVVGNVLQSS